MFRKSNIIRSMITIDVQVSSRAGNPCSGGNCREKVDLASAVGSGANKKKKNGKPILAGR